jgi:hypothetical protein
MKVEVKGRKKYRRARPFLSEIIGELDLSPRPKRAYYLRALLVEGVVLSRRRMTEQGGAPVTGQRSDSFTKRNEHPCKIGATHQ